jgi:hypothetical protein
MQSKTLRASNGNIMPSIRGPVAIRRALQRFAYKHRNAVTHVAAQHDRLADLAISFPALLFAIAVPRRGHDTCALIQSGIDGHSLRVLCGLADVPMWLRKLPPEAFSGPIPKLPGGELFSRQIGNCLPRKVKQSARWLSSVAEAARWGTEPFAIWMARELNLNRKWNTAHRPRLLALWAWYSVYSESLPVVMEEKWQASMAYDKAMRAALAWRDTIHTHLALGMREIEDCWLQAGEHDGYEFLPLLSAKAIVEEAGVMKNCLRSFGQPLMNDRIKLWSVRKQGNRVATLSTWRTSRVPIPVIREIKARANAEADYEIWIAASKWLTAQDFAAICARKPKAGDANFDRKCWRESWRPYWLAKQTIPAWLPLCPSVGVIWGL